MAPRAKRRGGLTRAQARTVLDILEKAHPDARIYLDYATPLQLLVATILAAQCTDAHVNRVTPGLFAKYPTASDFARATQAEMEKDIGSIGLFRRKADRIRRACRAVVDEHGGQVPADVDALTRIDGIGRKTANIVVGEAFGRQAVAVDTHVRRVATRLGMAAGKTVARIEKDLCELIPRDRWTRATQLLGAHGRRLCHAREPDCANCPVGKLCAYCREQTAP